MKLFEDGDPCFAPMLNALFAAFRGTAVMSGCEVSATGTSRTVSIAAGSVQINGVVIAVGAGSVTLDAGSTFDRYDLVSVNASGSKIVTKGTTKRKCPTQPANTCLLAIVFVPAGATVIATGNVYDARMDAPRLSVNQIQAASLSVNQIQAASANLAEITTSQYTLVPDPCVCYADNSTKTYEGGQSAVVKTSPPVPAGQSGTVAVHFNLKSNKSDNVYASIYRNGDYVGGFITKSESFEIRTANITVSPGDVLTLALRTNTGAQATNSLFEIRAIPLPANVNWIAW